MVLVPEAMYSNNMKQYQQQNISPETKNLVRLDNQMEDILQDTLQPADEKARQYTQYLQRYLTMYDKSNSPKFSKDILEKPAVENYQKELSSTDETKDKNETTNIEKEELESVPTTYKGRAQSLMRKLKSHPNKISWNDRGELITDGQVVPGTNLVDLVNDIVRPRKNFSPRGYEEFVQGLAKINTPEDLVRNDARRKLLLEYRDNPSRGTSPIARREHEETPSTRTLIPTPPSTISPLARKRRLPTINSKKQSPIMTRPSQWIRY